MAATVKVKSLRELDRLVAEHIFDWSDFWQWKGDSVDDALGHQLTSDLIMGYPPEERSMGIEAERVNVWNYSTEVAEAWAVVEKLRGFNRYSQCTDLTLNSGEEWWAWHFHDHTPPGNESVSAAAKTAPIAICLAALKTVGIEVELELPDE